MTHAPGPQPHATAELAMSFVAALRLSPGDLVRYARAADTARALLSRWAEPHRHFHTAEHLTGTLETVRLLAADPVISGRVVDSADLELAVWYHDAVRAGGRPGQDEEASARLAEEQLTELGLDPARVAEVARLVRLTAEHDPAPDDLAGQLVCDADLSVLGAPGPAYLAYARAIRREYAHVSDEDFRTGRAAILRRLGAGPTVFRSVPAQRLWETNARINLAAELARLADPLVTLPADTPDDDAAPVP